MDKLSYKDILGRQHLGDPEDVEIVEFGSVVTIHKVSGNEATALMLEARSLEKDQSQAIPMMSKWVARFLKGEKANEDDIKAINSNLSSAAINEIYGKGLQVQVSSKEDHQKN